MTGSETATGRSALGPLISRPALAVAGLVVASTVIRFAAAQAFTTPWIAPDEMVYGMLGEGLWSHGTLTLRTFASPYYSLLTPALIGAPLAALDDLADGIQWARVLQALAMSLVAVPTYVWARRLASPGGRSRRQRSCSSAPALHYAGFLMTEPLTLTVVTVALLMLARALEEPSMWRYGVFVAWATAAAAVRLQALVLLPAFLLAAVVDSVAARDGRRLRPLLWFGALAAAATVIVGGAILATGGELSTRRLLGAYTPVGQASGVSGDRFAEIAWHAFDVSVIGLGVTVLALAALAWVVLARHDTRSGPSRVRLDERRVRVPPGRPGRALRRDVRRLGRRAVPHLTACRCSRSACAPGSRVAHHVPSGSRFPSGRRSIAGAALVPIGQLASPETLPNAPTPAVLDRARGHDRTSSARRRSRGGGCPVPRPAAPVRLGRGGGRRARARALDLRLGTPDRRRIGARAARRRRFRRARVARRRRSPRRHAARHRRPALDGDRPHDLLEPCDPRRRPTRPGDRAVPARRRIGRDRRGGRAAHRERRAARSPDRRRALDGLDRRREGRRASGGRQRGLRARRVARRQAGSRRSSAPRGSSRTETSRARQGSRSTAAGRGRWASRSSGSREIRSRRGSPGSTSRRSSRRTGRRSRTASRRRRTRTERTSVSSSW